LSVPAPATAVYSDGSSECTGTLSRRRWLRVQEALESRVTYGQLLGSLATGEPFWADALSNRCEPLQKLGALGHLRPANPLALLARPLHSCPHQVTMHALPRFIPIPVTVPAQAGAPLVGLCMLLGHWCPSLQHQRPIHGACGGKGTECVGERRCFPRSEDLAPILYQQLAVQPLLHLDASLG